MTDYSNDDKPRPLDLEGGPLSSEPAKPKAAGKADGSVPLFDRASMVGLLAQCMACGDTVHIRSGKRISKKVLVWILACVWYAYTTLTEN